MQSTVTERGQISIPAPIRQKLRLKAGTQVEWLETDGAIYLLPIPKDPIAAFRGKGGFSTEMLLEERRKDRLLEEKRWNAMHSTRRPSSR